MPKYYFHDHANAREISIKDNISNSCNILSTPYV